MSNEQQETRFAESLWDTDTTAAFIGKSAKSLEADRLKGVGIPYIRLGRAVRYDPAAVRRYLAINTIIPSDGKAA